MYLSRKEESGVPEKSEIKSENDLLHQLLVSFRAQKGKKAKES